MNRLTTLQFELEEVIQEQSSLFNEIKELSKNPERTGKLLCQVTDSAVRYDDLLLAVLDEQYKTKSPFWKRPFMK